MITYKQVEKAIELLNQYKQEQIDLIKKIDNELLKVSILDKDINQLKLPWEVKKALKNAEINKISQLISHTKTDLELKLRASYVMCIEKRLKIIDLKLKDPNI